MQASFPTLDRTKHDSRTYYIKYLTLRLPTLSMLHSKNEIDFFDHYFPFSCSAKKVLFLLSNRHDILVNKLKTSVTHLSRFEIQTGLSGFRWRKLNNCAGVYYSSHYRNAV